MRLSCLARNGRSPGEESLAAAIAVQAIEAQPAFGQIKPMRGQVLACAEQHFGDVPASDRPTQEALRSRRAKRNPGVQKGSPTCRRADRIQRRRRDAPDRSRPKRLPGSIEVCEWHRDIAVMLTDWLFALIPTERRRIHGVTCPWSLPQSVTGLGPGQHSHPERAQSGSTRAPRRCTRR